MMNIPDDPIIACMELTGYPPVYSSDYEDEDIEEKEKKTQCVYLYFSDLKPEIQEMLLKEAGVNDPAEMGWEEGESIAAVYF